MKLTQITRLLALTLVCYGCANNPYTAKKEVKLSNNSKNGLAIVVVNTEGAPKGFRYIVQSLNNGTRTAIPEYGFKDQWSPMLLSDYEDFKGKLVVLNLPEGKYKFTEWFNVTSDQYGSYEMRSVQDFPIYFNVVGNKATYIGELYQTNEYDPGLMNSEITIVDNNKRDLKLFLSKYSNISHDDIVIKIAIKAEHKLPK